MGAHTRVCSTVTETPELQYGQCLTGPVLEEHHVQCRHLLRQSASHSRYLRLLLDERFQGPLCQASAIARFNESVALFARRPITDALTCNVFDDIGNEGARGIAPNNLRVRAEITDLFRHDDPPDSASLTHTRRS